MNLTNATALFWAGLAVPIVIFYILKIRMRRVPVSTIMFWHQIFEEKQPRSIWQKLRHLLSLLLQLAFLMLLVMALGDPFFDWQVREARRLVLIIDNSASMQATDVKPSRYAKAKEQANKLITALRQRDEMAIVAAGTQPKVVCGLTSHQRTLRSALGGLKPTDGPTRVTDALAIARRLLAEHKNGKAVILSDGGFDDATKMANADDVSWIQVGKKADNVAITRFQVRRSLLDPIGYQILVEVVNFSEQPKELRLEIELGAEIVDVVPLNLEPGKSWSQVFEKTSAAGGELVASLDQPDVLSVDNEARAILPRRERQKVVLVTKGNLFLQSVFAANALVDLKVTSEIPATVPPDTILVFHRQVPETIPTGLVMVIQPTKSTDIWELGGKLENPAVAKQDKDSPIMANVRLDNVLMPQAYHLKLKHDASILAETVTNDPLFFSIDNPQRKLVVLTVDLDHGDLPLRTAFPIMASNALSWFAGTKGELREALPTGAVAKLDIDEILRAANATQANSHGTLQLRAPDGSYRPLPDGVSDVTVGPLDQSGVWSIVKRPDPAEPGNLDATLMKLASNLANPSESDLGATVEATREPSTMAAGFFGRPIWFYLIVVACCLTVLEWFFYQRRWIS